MLQLKISQETITLNLESKIGATSTDQDSIPGLSAFQAAALTTKPFRVDSRPGDFQVYGGIITLFVPAL